MEVNYEVYPTFGVWLFSKIIFAVRTFVQSARVSFGQISVRAKWLENRLPSRARVRRFSIFLFTSSSVGRNAQYIRAQGVKALRKMPSPARWLILQLARQGEWRGNTGEVLEKVGLFHSRLGRIARGEVKGMVWGMVWGRCSPLVC